MENLTTRIVVLFLGVAAVLAGVILFGVAMSAVKWLGVAVAVVGLVAVLKVTEDLLP